MSSTHITFFLLTIFHFPTPEYEWLTNLPCLFSFSFLFPLLLQAPNKTPPPLSNPIGIIIIMIMIIISSC